MEIKEGSIVRLKSGGPAMTVGSVNESTAFCTWFTQGELKEHEFYKSQLVTSTT